MLFEYVGNQSLNSVVRCLQHVQEDQVIELYKQLVSPLLHRARDNAPAIAKAGAMGMAGMVLWWNLKRFAMHFWNDYQWQKRCYLSIVSAQLLTTQIHQPDPEKVQWVDKRTLFQKDLRQIGLFRDMHIQLLLFKAAARTTEADPFVTSFLRESDSWHVMNAMVNELSSIASLSHLHALQAAQDSSAAKTAGHSDWYVIALLSPKYSCSVARDSMGGVIDSSSAGRSEVKIRLVVVCERELWDIVCKRIRACPGGMLSERQERRWDILTKIARHYKRYIGRRILRKAVEDAKTSQSPGCARTVSAMSTGESTPDAQPTLLRSSTRCLQRLLSQSSCSEVPEVTRDHYMATASELGVPSLAASQMFDEFDLNHDNSVSLAEIDESMGCRFKCSRNYVDTHLMKVNLPCFFPQEGGVISFEFANTH